MGTAPRARNLLHFPHSVLLLPFVVAPLLLSFWTLHPQSLWWRRGEDVVTSVARLTACSTASSTPYYFLNPWTIWWQKPLLGDSLALPFSVVTGSLYAPAPYPGLTHDPSSPWFSSLMFCIAQEHHTYPNTLVDLEPVLHIRLTASGGLIPRSL